MPNMSQTVFARMFVLPLIYLVVRILLPRKLIRNRGVRKKWDRSRNMSGEMIRQVVSK